MYEQSISKYLQAYGFEHMRLKAVFFDMDGVLFDSMPRHAHSWHETATRFNLDLPYDEVFLHEGRTGDSTIEMLAQRSWGRSATPEERRLIYATKESIFNSLPEAPTMPGASNLIETIRHEGFQIILVTGSGQKSLLGRLNRHYPGVFSPDVMVTSFDVRQGKPSPEPYLQALHKAGVKPWEAIVVENAPLGVRAGVAAQIFTVAVNTGPLPDEALTSEGASLLFPSMQALADQWPTLQAELA